MWNNKPPTLPIASQIPSWKRQKIGYMSIQFVCHVSYSALMVSFLEICHPTKKCDPPRWIWLSNNKVQMNWVVLFENKSLKIEIKCVKVLQEFTLSQMKLLLVKRIYFPDNFHLGCRSSHWKELLKKISQHCRNSKKR